MDVSLQQRWQRFADEDLGTFAGCMTLFTGFQLAKELRSGDNSLALAVRRTARKLPVAAFSGAVGMAGMKLAIAGVTYARQDFSRENVVLAFPVFGALMNVHRGPRGIALGVAGFTALGYGMDYAAAIYHQRNFDAQRRLEEEQWQWESHSVHVEQFVPHSYEVLSTSSRED